MNERYAAWANRLRQWGLNGLAAAFLEAGGPLPFLGAQVLYGLEPLSGARSEVHALAQLLEDPTAVQALAQALAEEPGT